jgi:uncharacterized membrane protein
MSKNICSDTKNEKSNFAIYIFIILEIIAIYLGFYNRTMYLVWNIYDTLRFIIALIILRILYYIVKKYELVVYKTIVDITLVLILYLNGTRIIEIVRTSNINI